MEYIPIDHGPDALQRPVAPTQIRAMCEYTFGRGARVETVKELGGGQFNSTYQIQLSGGEAVILRVAPAESQWLFWHERFLMRRERSAQPFFAPIAPLIPEIIAADFSHRIIDRDYMFQRMLPGEVWSTVAQDVTRESRYFVKLLREKNATE